MVISKKIENADFEKNARFCKILDKLHGKKTRCLARAFGWLGVLDKLHGKKTRCLARAFGWLGGCNLLLV